MILSAVFIFVVIAFCCFFVVSFLLPLFAPVVSQTGNFFRFSIVPAPMAISISILTKTMKYHSISRNNITNIMQVDNFTRQFDEAYRRPTDTIFGHSGSATNGKHMFVDFIAEVSSRLQCIS